MDKQLQTFPVRTIVMGHPIQERWKTVEITGEPGWETVACVLAEADRLETPVISVEVWDHTDRTPVLIYAHVGGFEDRAYGRLCATQYRDGDPSQANQRTMHRMLRAAGVGIYTPESVAAIAAMAWREQHRRADLAHRRYVEGLRHGGPLGFIGRAVAELSGEQDREARDA